MYRDGGDDWAGGVDAALWVFSESGEGESGEDASAYGLRNSERTG